MYGIGKSTVNKSFKEELLNALNDDLNTSIALALIDDMINKANEVLTSEPKNKNLKKELVANLEFIQDVLGIATKDAYKYFQFGISDEQIKEIEKLIEQRVEAKKNKDFEKADLIREELSNKKISIMDTPNGVVWEKL